MPKIIDFNSEVSCLELFRSDNRTATGNGSGVDTLGYEGKLKITLDIGTVTGTTPTLDVKIQDSADNSTFADLSPAVAFAQQNAAGINHLGLDIRTVRRYVRAVATLGGTSPNFNFAVLAYGQKQTL
ncbi:MAG: hypothetical protein ABSG75_11165 [Syntrophales bacterium]|jgi:hypothetical protein